MVVKALERTGGPEEEGVRVFKDELRETILKVISKMKTTTTAEIFNLIRFGLLLLAPRSTSLFQEPRRSVVAGLLLVSVSLSSFEENMVEVVSQKDKGLD